MRMRNDYKAQDWCAIQMDRVERLVDENDAVWSHQYGFCYVIKKENPCLWVVRFKRLKRLQVFLSHEDVIPFWQTEPLPLCSTTAELHMARRLHPELPEEVFVSMEKYLVKTTIKERFQKIVNIFKKKRLTGKMSMLKLLHRKRDAQQPTRS